MKQLALVIAIIALIIGGTVAFWPRPENESAHSESSMAAEPNAEYYTCPMHPQVHKDKPGACPICGMSLVLRGETPASTGADEHSPGAVTLSPSKQILANVATDTARVMTLAKEVSAVGTIDYAEPNFRHISTRFAGRLDKLYLTYTGQQVKKGDPVAEVYSPDAVSAQQEYLLAKESYDQVKDEAEVISGGAKSMVDQSRQKLERWGFTNSQIGLLDSTGEVQNLITIYSPISGTVLKKLVDPQHYAAAGEDIYDVADLSTVWLNIDVYEYEFQGIRPGQTVTATTAGGSGETFSGKISFVASSVDPATRTVRVRADLRNPHGSLKTGMFVDSRIAVPLGKGLGVTTSAIISTGPRHLVWVESKPGMFEPREVQTGGSGGGYTQIISGLKPGEIVATSGGYLIDSESRLNSK